MNTAALPEDIRNTRAFQILEKSLKQGRLSHAILLHGENLKDLQLIADCIASDLLQTQTPATHPDYFVCRPRGKSRQITIGRKEERKEGKWPEGTIRRLVTDLAMTSNQGGHKIGILHEADCITTQATNAFLKTLEEPPQQTTLFLLTTRPYDLLDTIRSRCFNFRVPTASDVITHPNWAKWKVDYREWLGRLLQGPNKKTIPHIMMGAYGLNARFQTISADLSGTEWKMIKETLPEHLTKEELEAQEKGVSRTFRGTLFSEIEKATAGFARDVEALNKGELPASALHRATEALERSTGLMEINFNQVAALELFFLSSLRIWTTAR